MIQKLERSSGKTVGFRLSGEVTDNEYKTFANDIETIIADKGNVRLLLILEYPQELTLKAVWDNLIFWIKHINDIERLAIVGQKEWERWLEFLEHPFVNADVRYYKKSQLKEAWTWLISKTNHDYEK